MAVPPHTDTAPPLDARGGAAMAAIATGAVLIRPDGHPRRGYTGAFTIHETVEAAAGVAEAFNGDGRNHVDGPYGVAKVIVHILVEGDQT